MQKVRKTRMKAKASSRGKADGLAKADGLTKAGEQVVAIRSNRVKRLALLLCAALACAALACGCSARSGGGSSAADEGGGVGNNGGGVSASEQATGAQTEPASQAISVYSREDGSGTRGAFVELIGLEQEDASGEKVDMTCDAAVITNSTSVMMASVSGDVAGIGYLSMGSLNDTVKAVAIDGVEPTPENVKNGTYKISRPFNIVTAGELSAEAQDFMAFIMSAEGQAIVEENGYIAIDENAASYVPSGAAGKVVVAGSSSVTPVMEKLAEAYQAVNVGAQVEVQQSDSTSGVQFATDGTCDIGMASRELKDSEVAAGASAEPIALDGIAVIVSPASATSSLTTEQVRSIFAGETTDWSTAA